MAVGVLARRRARRRARTEKKATTEASRSIAEWIASVMIAIEPVIAPAASLSTIRVAFEAIERLAAPLFVLDHRGRLPARAQELGERPRRAPAVADRVLLVRLELGHRALVVGAGVDRDERRVVAEAAAAARLA